VSKSESREREGEKVNREGGDSRQEVIEREREKQGERGGSVSPKKGSDGEEWTGERDME
jgi:hypothetical protein